MKSSIRILARRLKSLTESGRSSRYQSDAQKEDLVKENITLFRKLSCSEEVVKPSRDHFKI